MGFYGNVNLTVHLYYYKCDLNMFMIMVLCLWLYCCLLETFYYEVICQKAAVYNEVSNTEVKRKNRTVYSI